ncbi:DUF3021 domain-containing protein [Enterococcus avium]|uniref:DUF3021 domain-containing protein n=1 Tax=Enterococcus avium TaxID=33945 RepID=UPI00288D8702|nr:DUF3021 domain-containing protein [Enterococcus avium]MDT2477454.1 DUF3021 domain-containing protein [Enterococcus avium]
MIKRILSTIGSGIALGSLLFTITCMILFLIGGPQILDPIINNYVWQGLGSMLVGIAFSTPSLVYESDTISLWKKVAIHMSIGFAVYFPLAFYFKWIPTDQGTNNIILYVILAITISFGIWAYFYFSSKVQAKRINKKLRDVQKNQKSHF